MKLRSLVKEKLVRTTKKEDLDGGVAEGRGGTYQHTLGVMWHTHLDVGSVWGHE